MQSLAGHLLIATPQLLAPIFVKSVILMLHHDDDGAMGLILNRPTQTTVTALAGKIFDDEFVWEKLLHLGGPVPGPLTVLHGVEKMSDQEAIPGVFQTLEASKVQQLISQRPEPSLVIANYSGWGPGQLEGEFGWESWLTLPATAEHVLGAHAEDLWDVVMKQANVRKLSEFLGLKTVPQDPSVN